MKIVNKRNLALDSIWKFKKEIILIISEQFISKIESSIAVLIGNARWDKNLAMLVDMFFLLNFFIWDLDFLVLYRHNCIQNVICL